VEEGGTTKHAVWVLRMKEEKPPPHFAPGEKKRTKKESPASATAQKEEREGGRLLSPTAKEESTTKSGKKRRRAERRYCWSTGEKRESRQLPLSFKHRGGGGEKESQGKKRCPVVFAGRRKRERGKAYFSVSRF